MSQLLDRAVDELAKLPGVGERTALRLALHLLRQPVEGVDALAGALVSFRRNIKFCRMCNNLSDSELCPICADASRDKTTVCVVEQVKDVLSIEHTRSYRGLYHVLGGVISPIQGVGPSDLKINLLTDRVGGGEVKEVILALSTSIEGETTGYYISRQLSDFGVKVSTIARGIGFGDEIDYADDITLVHAISNRTTL
ncbi:MAG: recombination mediator RecR [Rikenellaceae bacterium]|nr:recombination mediator RecR [Rikenellaceae bacterium]